MRDIIRDIIGRIKQIKHIKHIRLLIIPAAVLLAAAIPFMVFHARAPVLVVTDVPFAALYGEANIKRQKDSSGWSLFRPVKPVILADGASADMVVFAITETSSRPFCVLFPRAHSSAASQFHEQFPDIPAVLFAGLLPVDTLPSPDGVLCVYRTDIQTDMYRAGLFAGILGTAKQKPAQGAEGQNESVQRTYAFWQDRSVQAAEQGAFTRGLREYDPEAVVVFAGNAAGMPNAEGVSCVILTGAGAEYLENNPKMPVILFSWVDPGLTSREIAVQFDDSAWALAPEAVKMAMKKQAEGIIPSNPLTFSRKIGNNNVYKTLKKSAKKVP